METKKEVVHVDGMKKQRIEDECAYFRSKEDDEQCMEGRKRMVYSILGERYSVPLLGEGGEREVAVEDRHETGGSEDEEDDGDGETGIRVWQHANQWSLHFGSHHHLLRPHHHLPHCHRRSHPNRLAQRSKSQSPYLSLPFTFTFPFNEITVIVEYLKCALKAIKRLAKAHSDLSVGVFAAGQPIRGENEREESERTSVRRVKERVSGAKEEEPIGGGRVFPGGGSRSFPRSHLEETFWRPPWGRGSLKTTFTTVRMEQDPAAFLQEMRRRMEALQAEIETLRAERDAAGGAQANRPSSARAQTPPIVEMPETEPDSEEDTDPNPDSYYQGGGGNK
ncbi:hypothetical protein LR48_Vigan661s001700 [Vigna angularis]|uniref:Uncharacterized protein n=1 Tax=Phaseolus angularis TaxID=3914 RepID=A0A0L9TFI3_PHAAN|nr:hypothetical protein LR48_Vigan661s001700 [Vigna angularis]